MKAFSHLALAGGLALVCTACAPSTGSTTSGSGPAETHGSAVFLGDRINLGTPDSEAAHGVTQTDTTTVQSDYPEFWIMSVRASSFLEGHEPYHVVDGDETTSWQTVGKPPFPMVRGQFVEVEMNEPTVITDVSVRWLNDEPQKIKIYSSPFSDYRKLVFEGTSAGTAEMETFTIEAGIDTRAIRVEYEPTEDGEPQGIAEVRLDRVPFPSGYPLALEIDAPVQRVERAYYVEFQRFFKWPVFNLKRPLGDGGAARMLLPTEEFEGGHLDFDIAVDPEKTNTITLKTWANQPNDLSAGGNAIALELLVDDPVYRGRWYLPAYVTRDQVQLQEWYGVKPTPGHWAFATFTLPEAVTRGQTQVRLRLQGIGNGRRDRAMREPAPPVYEITSQTGLPFVD